MRARYCFIDGCRSEATLILHSYPDDTLLCATHRHLAEDDEYPAEPCEGAGCWCHSEVLS